jgi:hypothetical protein
MALGDSFTVDGKLYKPTIFYIQAQAAYAKSLIFIAEARVAVRAHNFIWAAIASYYSLFHLTNFLMFACPQLVDLKLMRTFLKTLGSSGAEDPTNQIQHRVLSDFLKECEVHGLPQRVRSLLTDARKVREEYANYGPRIIWRRGQPTFLTHGFRPSDVRKITLGVAPLLKKALLWSCSQSPSSEVICVCVAGALKSFLENRDLHYAVWCSTEVLREAELIRTSLGILRES